jgi:hypothetical protein
MARSNKAGNRCSGESDCSNKLRRIGTESIEHSAPVQLPSLVQIRSNIGSPMIEVIFGAFSIMALLLFCLAPPAYAVATTCFAGWLLLPVGNFPAGSAEAVFPYWITGAAVPSDMLLTKMWWPPVVALLGALLTGRKTLAQFRPGWVDVPMGLWCLWPLVQWAAAENPDPKPWIATLYLAAAWGTPWLLGRVYFSGFEGGRRLMISLAAGLVVIAPIALIEGILGPRVYGWFYGPHPFRFDGQERYVGFRPLAFFENGNQYGIWVAATALAALWLSRSTVDNRNRVWRVLVAGLALTVTIASQSVGATILLCGGLALSWAIGRRVLRRALAIGLLLIVMAGAIYVSGVIPLRSLAENTVVGRQIVDTFRSSGRGSFIWRIARDQTALNLVGQHPIFGTGRWDWWRENGQRPWGLALLFVGQFGMIGLVLAFSSLLLPTLCAIFSKQSPNWRQRSDIPLAAIVVMAIADALSNSFFFYPALLAVGGLATPQRLWKP